MYVIVGGLMCLQFVSSCRSRSIDRQEPSAVPESTGAESIGEADEVEATEEPLTAEDEALLAGSTATVKNPSTLSMTVNHCRTLSTTRARVTVNSQLHSSSLNCKSADSDNFTIDGIDCRVSKVACSRLTKSATVRAKCGNRITVARINCVAP